MTRLHQQKKLYKILVEKLGRKERVQDCLITAFCESPNFIEARDRFDVMKDLIEKIDDESLIKIKNAYAKNDQLKGSIYLNRSDRLLKFLQNTTGSEFTCDGSKIFEKPMTASNKFDDDIPF